ncbi:MAG: MFS transporter [Alphaproteobacteria bacterium]|nr:MFS transporter [Alphaproteobacteria bacterium]
MSDSEAAAAGDGRRAGVIFIFFVLMLDVLAMGVGIPVWPDLIKGFLGDDLPRAVEIGGYMGVGWAVMQFLCTPVQGALSDHFGRRPVLLFSMIGLALDYVLMAVAPNLWWLVVGRLISGATAASFSTANAYIADVTPVEKRPAAFGLMGAAFGVGFVLGPALGGYLGSFDPRLPFWVAAGLGLLNALYGYFILPESLPPERRMKFSILRANPIGSLNLLASSRKVAGLATANFFYLIGHNVYPAIFVWFAQYRYGWTPRMVGIALAVVGVMSIIVNGGLVGPVVKALGTRRSILTGLSFGIIGFLLYAVGPTEEWVWVAIPVAALWGIYGPAAQTEMTHSVDPHMQGQLQGALASLMGLASIISPGLYTQVFARAIDPASPVHVPGAPFYLAAFLLVCAFAFAWWATKPATAQAPAE